MLDREIAKALLKKVLICVATIVILFSAVIVNRYRPRRLLHGAAPLHESVMHLSVRHGPMFGTDITHYINQDELLYLLAQTRIRRDISAWPGAWPAEWVISLVQDGNRFHRTISIALGETHGMMTERGFGMPTFRISNGDEIMEALERMMEEY